MATLESSLVLRDKFTSTLEKIDDGLQKATRSMTNMQKKVTAPADAFKQLSETASTAVSRMNSRIKNKMQDLFNEMETSNNRIIRLFGNFGNRTFKDLENGLVNSKAKFSQFKNHVQNSLKNAFDNGKNHFNNFKNHLQSGLNRLKGAFQNFSNNISSSLAKIRGSGGGGNMFRSMLGALGIYKVAGAVSSGVNNLVAEMTESNTTWKAFEGNMSRIGKSNQEIKRVQKSLEDFATQSIYSASDMSSTYSQMAAIGVDGAEKIVRGMGGLAASAEDPKQAMRTLSTQMVQALAKPKLQWMDFKLMLEQSPAAMAAVAEHMGYSLADFLIALENGEILSKDFAQAIGEVGTNADFEKMATEFKNAGQAMDGFYEALSIKFRPLFNSLDQATIQAIEAVSNALDRLDLRGLSKKLDDFLKELDFEEIVNRAVEGFENLRDKFSRVWESFKDTGAVESISSAFDSIGEALKNIYENIDYEAVGSTLGKVADFFAKITGSIADFIAKADPGTIRVVSNAILGLVTAVAGLKIGGRLFEIGSGIGGLIGAPFKFIRDLFGGKKGLTESPIPKNVPSMSEAFGPVITDLGGLAKKAGNLALIFGVIKIIQELAEALKDINDKVPTNLVSLAPKLINMGVALGGIGYLTKRVGEFVGMNMGAAIKGTLFIVGISANIILAAQAMKQVNDKVSSDLVSTVPKMINMAIGIGGIGILTGVAGKFAQANPFAAVTGLLFVAGISANIILAAQAMKRVNDAVPDDIGNFSNKIANMAIALGSMSLIVGVAGLVVASGIGALIGGAGLLAIAAVAGELVIVAKSLKAFNDSVPDNISEVESKIELVKNAIKAMSAEAFSGLIGNLISATSFIKAKESIDSLAEVAKQMEVLSLISFDSETVKARISDVKSAIQSLSRDSLGEFLSGIAGFSDFEGAVSAIAQVVNVASQLSTLSLIEFSVDSVKAKIYAVKQVVQELNNFPQASGGFSGIQMMVQEFARLTEQISIFSMTSQTNLSSLAQSVSSSMNTIQEVTKVAMDSFVQSVISGINRSVQISGNGARQMVSAFSGLRTQLYSIGVYSMSGLSSGIYAGAGQAIAAARSVANRVSATIRSALDIHSPSRVMMKIGRFIPVGLAKGMSSAEKLVEKASWSMSNVAITPSVDYTRKESGSIGGEHLRTTRGSSYYSSDNRTISPVINLQVDYSGDEDGAKGLAEQLLVELEDNLIQLLRSDML